MTTLVPAALLALGEHRPTRSVSNDDLALSLDTSDEWIRTRTGIRTRRIAGADESVVSMAADAAAKAVAASGVDPGSIDLVILATCSLPTPVPGGAARVASLIGASRAGGYDVNAACAGFCYGLAAAADAVRAGTAQHVVVIGSEKLSDWTDWSDRSSAILFGDGAGAAVVGTAPSDGIGPVVWGTDGSAARLIDTGPTGKLRLDGPAVFRWATTTLGPVAKRACAVAGIEPAELSAVVPHQANLRIVTAIARSLGATGAVVADDIVDNGNTSSASVPLALSRLVDRGDVGSGDAALILGFGAGLTWAAQVVRIP